MREYIGAIVGLALAFFVGCESKSGAERAALGEERPDFSKPEVLEKILGEAEFRDTLAERGPVGEKLLCAFYSEAPYTGWAKEMYRNGKVRMLLHYKDGRTSEVIRQWDFGYLFTVFLGWSHSQYSGGGRQIGG